MRWNLQLPPLTGALYVQSIVVGAGGAVFALTDNTLYKVDSAPDGDVGTLSWAYSATDPPTEIGTTMSDAIIGSDGTIYVTVRNPHRVVALR